MSELIAGLFAVAVMFGFGVIVGWLAFAIGPQREAVEECRKAHNVYQCEFIQEARPVTPSNPNGEGK